MVGWLATGLALWRGCVPCTSADCGLVEFACLLHAFNVSADDCTMMFVLSIAMAGG